MGDNPIQIVNLQEAARRLGLSTIRPLKSKNPDTFPKPIGQVGKWDVYDYHQINTWYTENVRHGKPGPRPKNKEIA